MSYAQLTCINSPTRDKTIVDIIQDSIDLNVTSNRLYECITDYNVTLDKLDTLNSIHNTTLKELQACNVTYNYTLNSLKELKVMYDALEITYNTTLDALHMSYNAISNELTECYTAYNTTLDKLIACNADNVTYVLKTNYTRKTIKDTMIDSKLVLRTNDIFFYLLVAASVIILSLIVVIIVMSVALKHKRKMPHTASYHNAIPAAVITESTLPNSIVERTKVDSSWSTR